MRKLFIILLPLFFFSFSCKILKKDNNSKEKITKRLRSQNSAFFIDGKMETVKGNYERAMALFLNCIKKDPKHTASRFELARVYDLYGRFDKSLEYAQQAAKIAPDNVWYQMLYAKQLQNNKKYKEASSVYKKLVSKHPDNIDYYYNYADSYLLTSDYDKALKVYEKLEARKGFILELTMQKQKIFTDLKKYDKAIIEFEKLCKIYPENTKYKIHLAELYLTDRRGEDAFKLYKTISKKEPDNGYVNLALADYYRFKGQKEKSFEHIKKAFNNKSLDIDAKISIMLSYYSITENYEELKYQAFELAEILIKIHPDEAKAFSMYADFLFREDNFKEARDAFRKVVQLDETKYIIWEQLLISESELKDFKAMASESEKAMLLFPEQVMPYLFNGIANYRLKKYDKALVSLTMGLNFVGDNKDIKIQLYSFIGDSNYRLKKNNESDNAYESVLKIDSANVYVLNNYSYYLSLKGENLDKAEKMAKKLNQLIANNSTYLDTYAWVLYKVGKYDLAEKTIAQSIENGGNKNPVILEHYGDILFKVNKKDKALEYWKKAKEKGKGKVSEFLDKKIKEKKLFE